MPSGMVGAVPETNTCDPTRTAREKPTIGSYGEADEISLRSIGNRSVYHRRATPTLFELHAVPPLHFGGIHTVIAARDSQRARADDDNNLRAGSKW